MDTINNHVACPSNALLTVSPMQTEFLFFRNSRI